MGGSAVGGGRGRGGGSIHKLPELKAVKGVTKDKGITEKEE